MIHAMSPAVRQLYFKGRGLDTLWCHQDTGNTDIASISFTTLVLGICGLAAHCASPVSWPFIFRRYLKVEKRSSRTDAEALMKLHMGQRKDRSFSLGSLFTRPAGLLSWPSISRQRDSQCTARNLGKWLQEAAVTTKETRAVKPLCMLSIFRHIYV